MTAAEHVRVDQQDEDALLQRNTENAAVVQLLGYILISAALCAIWFAAGIAIGMYVLRTCQ